MKEDITAVPADLDLTSVHALESVPGTYGRMSVIFICAGHVHMHHTVSNVLIAVLIR